MQALLHAGARLDLPERRGWTPLMFASSCNRVHIVRQLLLCGAQPNARNNDGSTALAEACCLAHSGKAHHSHTVIATPRHLTPAEQMQPLSFSATERTWMRATSSVTRPS